MMVVMLYDAQPTSSLGHREYLASSTRHTAAVECAKASGLPKERRVPGGWCGQIDVRRWILFLRAVGESKVAQVQWIK